MCECFKPAFTDYVFAKGIGILGHRMWDVEHLGYRFLSGLPKDAESCSEQIGRLVVRLDAELNRASQKPLDEIPEFKITWSSVTEFQAGYIAGLKELRVGLGKLMTQIERARSSSPEVDVFHEVIATWAVEWQDSHSDLNFMNLQPFATDDLGQSQLRILSGTRASFVSEEDPTQGLIWLEVEMLDAYPVEALISELWEKLTYGDFAIGFSRGDDFISTESVESQLHNFEFDSLCDEHWQRVVTFNTDFILAAGQRPLTN